MFRVAYLCFFLLCITLCNGQGNYVPIKVPAKAEKELEEAVFLAKGGQFETAIGMIEGIIKKYPSWTTARKELSKIFYLLEKRQNAIDQLEALLAIDTLSQLQELYTLGRIYEEVSQPEKAMACYEAVLEKKPADKSLTDRVLASKQALEKKKDLWKSKEVIQFHSFDADINTP